MINEKRGNDADPSDDLDFSRVKISIDPKVQVPHKNSCVWFIPEGELFRRVELTYENGLLTFKAEGGLYLLAQNGEKVGAERVYLQQDGQFVPVWMEPAFEKLERKT